MHHIVPLYTLSLYDVMSLKGDRNTINLYGEGKRDTAATTREESARAAPTRDEE